MDDSDETSTIHNKKFDDSNDENKFIPESQLNSNLDTKNLDYFVSLIITKKMLGSCKYVGDYDQLDRIGQGAYGIVYRAKNIKTNEIAALKQIKIEDLRWGFPISSIREINILRQLRHPNVVKFHDVVAGKELQNVYLVMEYCEHDLATFIDKKIPFDDSQVSRKCLSINIKKKIDSIATD
ncbi:cyclin-dependent kinase 10-like protein [Sarcoptes scabiei]|uniref:cyclin-dependent kinase n=1 Tax=Sarcoptes scabiei TaxID=52283 RepID=A0A132AB19_SARSC|nr:cyclin-dependent kinase 10-like protein [Sarcoptes scabiei]